MVDSQVDSARQLSLSGIKNLKRFINIEIAGPQGPSAEFAGAVQCVPVFVVRIGLYCSYASVLFVLVCIVRMRLYCSYWSVLFVCVCIVRIGLYCSYWSVLFVSVCIVRIGLYCS